MDTLRSQIDRWAVPAKQAPLEHVRVHGIKVNISLPSIRNYLYGEDVYPNRTPLTTEFDDQWQIVKDGQFLREPSLRETTKIWMDLHLSIDGEGADWVTEMKGAINNANLTFTKNVFMVDCSPLPFPHSRRYYSNMGSCSTYGGDDSPF